MTEPTDIKALDEYLKKGSEVSERYRELGREEVPPELDRRVLAAARAAVANEGSQRSRSWLRWSAPVALAASVVLVVTVVLERGVQDDTVTVQQAAGDVHRSNPVRDQAAEAAADAAAQTKLAEEAKRQEQFVPEAPAEEPPAIVAQRTAQPVPAAVPPPAAATAAKAEAARFREVPEAVEVEARQLHDRVQTSPVAAVTQIQTVPPPAQAAEPISARKSLDRSEAEADTSDVSEVAVTGTRTRRGMGRTAGPRNTISSNSRAGVTADEQAERSDPEQWLEDIRELRRAGKTADADREWEHFLEVFPDFKVADDDVARKK